MSTYYVDTAGSDGATGLSEVAAWATVAKVNASTFLPDDSILFKRGCTWREMLLVPSSGTDGSPITFGAYSSGANPIINGSDIAPNAEFSEYPFPDYICDNLNVGTNSTGDGATRNYREIIPASLITASATSVKIQLRAAPTGSWVIAGVGIGVHTTGPNAESMTRVTWSGGSNGVTIPADTTVTSDEITFALDETKALVVAVYMTSRYVRQSAQDSGVLLYSNSTAADHSQIAEPGYTSSTFPYGMTTGIIGNGLVSCYSRAQTVDPYEIWEDGTFLQRGTALADAATAGKWYWDDPTNTLYVRASDASAIPSNGKVYEVGGARTECIQDGAKDWLIIESIDCIRSGQSDANLGGILIEGSHSIVRDLTASQHRRHCLTLYMGAANNLVDNVVLYDSEATSPLSIYGTGTTANVVQDSTIYQLTALCTANPVVIHGTAHDNVIQDCEIYRTYVGLVPLVYIYDAGTDRNIIQRCYIHGGYDCVLMTHTTDGTIFRSNLVLTAATITIALRMLNAINTEIINNTLYGTPVYDAVRLEGTSTGATIKNNIFYTGRYVDVAAASAAGLGCDYNCYYSAGATPFRWAGTAYSYADWKTQSGQDAHSVNSDPLFVNASSSATTGFRLGRASPCRGAGTTTGAAPTDYVGVVLPYDGSVDIGCMQWTWWPTTLRRGDFASTTLRRTMR